MTQSNAEAMMRQRLTIPVLLGMGCFAFSASARADDPALAAFENDVRPIVRALCYECHGPERDEGGIRFDQLNPDLVNGPDAETWHDALDQPSLGEMLPPKAKQPMWSRAITSNRLRRRPF